MESSTKILVFVAIFFVGIFAYSQTSIGEKLTQLKEVKEKITELADTKTQNSSAKTNDIYAYKATSKKYAASLYLHRYEEHIKLKSCYKSHLRQTNNKVEKMAIIDGLVMLSQISGMPYAGYESNLTALLIRDQSPLGKKRLRLHFVALGLAKKQYPKQQKKVSIAGSTPEMDAIDPLVRLYWLHNPNDALSVYWRESSGLPYELNHGGCQDFGITQINLKWQKHYMQKYGLTLTDLYDPVINVAFGRIVYSNWKCSFKPWVASRKLGIH